METNLPSHIHQMKTEFLPYLWGMETGIPCKQPCNALSSYRTYEEWKQL